MNIDIASIEPGGKVSVTLTDGTKIIDSPVTVGSANLGEALFIADGCVCLRNALDHLTVRITSVDAYYTPPAPEWDRPEVYAVIDRALDVWVRDHGCDTWSCVTTGGAHAPEISPTYKRWSTDKIASHFGGNVRVYAKRVRP